MTTADDHLTFMSRALELAVRGRGHVEPNPLVGCVVVKDGKVVGQGWHQSFGSPHAEVEALAAAGDAAKGATVVVTLEPCCHQGKTGPCTRALMEAGVQRVVVGCQDPNPQVAGKGLAKLREAGILVEEGVLGEQARSLIAPFAKLLSKGRPWIIAKWAMTLDGKLASHTGNSQWISGPASRVVVHRLRGEVDAILVGRGTVEADDPRLTARPAGPRVATRVVLDSAAMLSTESQLVRSIDEGPVLVAVASDAPADRIDRLTKLGVEVFQTSGSNEGARFDSLLEEMGRRQWTNVLVEGGSHVLGTLLDLQAIDEVHAFIATKLVGGKEAPSAMAGQGVAMMADAIDLSHVEVEVLEGDIHIWGSVG
ncbi:MAG: bifunctional diaminohydroxyphosphoribosylaminopyrimidine deaminase/5-amino-6-(5-phosphoribosylamino)uracil reductase RibD [Planctomycetes bacterium]|nr:bifunctional diaminohydroxyphosphoribosylaminopyrimidine deaminase/5-amino-6-(5-phosphoribosylamino)uracil reductase RibD [Planctomycetota bacterium]